MILQRTTLRYLNADPQWTLFNRGPWQRLEENLRKAIEYSLHSSVEVYTGVSGIQLLNELGPTDPGIDYFAAWLWTSGNTY